MINNSALVARGAQIVASGTHAPRPTPNDVANLSHRNGNPADTRRRRERNTQRHDLLKGLITAKELDGLEFPPLAEHVPDLVTEGFGIFAGPPKVGKSWLADGLALAVAQGGTALGGITVHHRRSVLLLALEDGRRRLQTRMRRLNHDQPLPAGLDIITDITPGAVLATIDRWMRGHTEADHKPLVILDTLGRARPQRRPGDDPYIADYQLGAAIKQLTDAMPGSALIAVHHTRKMASEDFLDTVSGTQGIAGSADYVLVLRRKRKSDEGTLAVTGRDIAESEYALTVDNGIWSLDGEDTLAAAARATSRDERERNRLGDRSLDALTFVNSRETTTPAELAGHLGIDSQEAGRQLKRLLDGEHIDKAARGTYIPLANGKSGNSGKTADQHLPANLPL